MKRKINIFYFLVIYFRDQEIEEHRTIPINGGETTLNIPQHLNHGQHVQTGLDENTRDENEGRMINSTASDAIHDENEDCEESSSDEFETDNEEVMRETNSVQRFVDKQKLLSNMVEGGTLHGMIKYINDNLHNFKEKVMKVAVIGRSGAGKSSLINALRGLMPTDDGGAAVGETETTSEINKYTYPDNDNVILLDVPGMDTWRFPIKKYLKLINYKTIDVFIIVVSVRIYETDIDVLKKLTDYKKYVMVVRSKIDMDIQNAKRNYPKDFNEKQVLYCLKQDLKSNITKQIREFDDNLFLISAVLTKEYDFPYLTKTLRRFLNKKGTLISKLIYILVKRNIQEEKLFCQNYFVFAQWAGRVYVFLPEAATVYLINKKVAEIHKTCLKRFCLDKNSLEYTEVKTLLITQEIKKKLEECSLELFQMNVMIPNMFRFILPNALCMVSNSTHIGKSTFRMCDVMASCELCLVKIRLQNLKQELSSLPSRKIVSNNSRLTLVKDTVLSYFNKLFTRETEIN